MTITDHRTDAPDPEQFLGTAITAAAREPSGPVRIPTARYRDPAFAALEHDRLWPRVWQIACSVDHVAEAGDWFEYRAGALSVLIVRGDDGELRAFQNACRHRGNVICTGAGAGLTELRCGFHNWTWDLTGRLRQVPSRKGFGALRNDDLPLLAARVDTWGRLVFVNLDLDAEPLGSWLDGVPADVAWADLSELRCRARVTIPIETNWKLISEGFSETYHVQGLHSQMLGCLDDVNSTQELLGRHSVSRQPYGVPSPRLGRNVAPQTVWDSFVVTQGGRMGVDETGEVPTIPEGQTVRDVIAQTIREHHRSSRGVDLSRFSTEEVTALQQYNLFPNATVLVSADLVSVLIAVPGTATDRAELVAMNFERAASADAPRSQPFDATVPYEHADLGAVLNQDLALLGHAQVGIRQPGLTHLTLSNEEIRIINMHRTLERFLADDPATLPGGAMEVTPPG
jgi:choline monooxygenase